MSIRKILALLLAVVMVCSLFVSPALAADDEGIVAISDTAAPKFSDADGHWAESAINRWAEEGIIQGYGDGTVNPGGNLKRAELAAILVRLLGLKEKAAAGTFSDVPADAWYADAVLKCAKAGIMLGDGTGKANPETTIDRQQTIVMVGRALGVKPAKGSSLDRFEDGDAVADWAAPYMIALTDMGILNGIPEGDGVVVAPTQDINRASTFTLLDKAIAKYITAPCAAAVDDANKFVVINSAAEETGEVTVTGTTAGVVVATGTTDDVVLDKADVGTLKVDAPVSVTVSKGSSVDDLDANAAAKIDNKGDVTNLNTNADDVTFDGNKPTKVNTAEDVKPATDSKGQVVTEKPTSSGSTGGSNRPTTTPDASVTTALFHDTRADAQGAVEGTFVPDEALKDGYSVTSNKVNGVTEVTVNHKHIMQHQNAASPASLGYWTGYAVKAPEGTTSAKYAYLAEKVDEPALAGTPLEDIDQKGTMGLAAYYNVNTEPTNPYFVVEWTITKEDETTETVTNWYHATFKTEKAPDAENVKLYEVHDKATFEALPEAVQEVMGGWDPLRDEATVIADTDFPWLVVVYDRNIIGTITFTAKVNGQDVEIKPDGATMNAATIGTEKCISFALTKFTNAANVTSGAYLYENDATTVYAPTVVAVNGIASNAVTPVPKPGKQLFKVTFVDGDTTTEQSVVAVGNTATVTLPAAPEREGYYFTGWGVEGPQGQMNLVAAGAQREISADTTFTAQYVEVEDQTYSFRPNGPEVHEDHDPIENFEYAKAYGNAGVAQDGKGAITVDGTALYSYVNNAEYDGERLHIMGHKTKATSLFIGLEYVAPAEATEVVCASTLEGLAGSTAKLDLTTESGNVYQGKFINYFKAAVIDENEVITFQNGETADTDTDYYLWRNGDKVVAVTKANVSVSTTNLPQVKVTFEADGETVETKTVGYNTAIDELPALPAKDGYTAGKWMAGGQEVTAETKFTADTKVIATSTAIEYKVSVDFSGESDNIWTVEGKKGADPAQTSLTLKWEEEPGWIWDGWFYDALDGDGQVVTKELSKLTEVTIPAADLPKYAYQSQGEWIVSLYSMVYKDGDFILETSADAITAAFTGTGWANGLNAEAMASLQTKNGEQVGFDWENMTLDEETGFMTLPTNVVLEAFKYAGFNTAESAEDSYYMTFAIRKPADTTGMSNDVVVRIGTDTEAKAYNIKLSDMTDQLDDQDVVFVVMYLGNATQHAEEITIYVDWKNGVGADALDEASGKYKIKLTDANFKPVETTPTIPEQGEENASLSAAEPTEVAAPAPVVSSRGDDERVEEPVMD